MVSLYFDRDFINAFIKREDGSDSVLNDFFNKCIKQIRGVQIFVNLESLAELQRSIEEIEFYYLLSEINSIQLLDIKSKLNSKSFYTEGSVTKLFFIENCDELQLENKSKYHFISNKTLKKKWKVFMSDQENSELMIQSNPLPNDVGIFRSWKDLNLFPHLIKNILVFDLYALSNKSDQRIIKNLIPCITALASNNEANVENLTIITKELPSKIQPGLWQEKDLTITFSYLEALQSIINTISIIKYDETKKLEGDSEHNRFILTNYFYIRLEAGINIFTDKGTVNHRDTIKFDSILNNRTRRHAKAALQNINLYLNKLKEKEHRAVGAGTVVDNFNFYPKIKCPYFLINQPIS